MEGGIQTAPMEKWANITKTMEVHPGQVGDYVKTGWVILMAYMRRTDIPDQQFQNNAVVYTSKQVYEPIVLIGQTNIESMMAVDASTSWATTTAPGSCLSTPRRKRRCSSAR